MTTMPSTTTTEMQRDYIKEFSHALGREMEVLHFGHAGRPLLVFPTSMGRFYQWEDFGLVGALSDLIESGAIQLVCVDSVDGESWYAKDRPPAERAWRQVQYNSYILNEVLPFSTHRNSNTFLITTGTSFGAYHAVNFAFRYPHLVNRVIGMSGL